MIELTFCVPYSSMEETVFTVLKEHPLTHRIKKNIFQLEVKDLPGLTYRGDVFIARGVAANIIRNSGTSIPVIEIPITGHDIIHAVHECKKSYAAGRIACIGSPATMYGVRSIGEAMQVELDTYHISGEEEGEQLVLRAMESGVDAIVGGLMVTKLAADRSFPSVMIESGYESIRQAVDEAIRTALIARAERARVKRFRTIMDYSYEGIVAVDESGKISLFNKVARDINETKDTELLGLEIDSVLPEIELAQVLKTGKQELEELRTIRGAMVSANCVPLQIDDEIVGAVATFQRISRIQEVEERIRQKIYKKGLTAKYRFRDIVGKSGELNETVALAEQYAGVDSNILLLGETGTGKELFAQSIHNASDRSRGPFVAVNCAAIPENLLESELFGYVEGAFTGASKAGKAGLFELAHRGTIFLDEVSELSLPLQARLLRVLQEKEIMRLGHDRVIPIDVRIIAATNRQLKELVEQERFRTDLLYRLDVLRITIPPLRKRKDDIPPLLEHYIDQNMRRFKKSPLPISDAALCLLTEYSWPGNVRELINICERIAIFAAGGEINVECINRVLDVDTLSVCADPDERILPDGNIDDESLASAEKQIIAAALRQTEGSRKRAAALLGIDTSTLWRKIRKHGMGL